MTVFAHFPKDTDCQVCQITKTTPARCKQKQISEMRQHYKILNLDDESRNDHWNALIVRTDTRIGYRVLPRRAKTHQKQHLCGDSSIPKARKDLKVCQELGWTQDTNTPRQETDRITETVRRVKEGTATAMVQSGLPDQLFDGLFLPLAQRARQDGDWRVICPQA